MHLHLIHSFVCLISNLLFLCFQQKPKEKEGRNKKTEEAKTNEERLNLHTANYYDHVTL